MSEYPKCPKCMSKNLHIGFKDDGKDYLSCEECGYFSLEEEFHK